MSEEMPYSVPAPLKTPELIARLMALLVKGYSRNTACKLVRLNRATFYSWLKKDSEFAAQVREAEAQGEAVHVDYIAKEQDWRARAWLLERRNREDWGRKDELNVNVDTLTDAQALKLADRLALLAAESGEADDEGDGDDELRALPG